MLSNNLLELVDDSILLLMFSIFFSHWTGTEIDPTKFTCTAVVSNNFSLVYKFNIIILFYKFFLYTLQQKALQKQFI